MDFYGVWPIFNFGVPKVVDKYSRLVGLSLYVWYGHSTNTLYNGSMCSKAIIGAAVVAFNYVDWYHKVHSTVFKIVQ